MKILTLLFFSLMTACVFSNTTDNHSVKLSIVPSGGGGSGFVICLKQDKLNVSERNLGIQDGRIIITDEKKFDVIPLLKVQADSLSALLNDIDHFKYDSLKNNGFVLDTWIYSLQIDEREAITFNSIILTGNFDDKSISSLQRLIKYLIEISMIEPKLQSFS